MSLNPSSILLHIDIVEELSETEAEHWLSPVPIRSADDPNAFLNVKSRSG